MKKVFGAGLPAAAGLLIVLVSLTTAVPSVSVADTGSRSPTPSAASWDWPK